MERTYSNLPEVRASETDPPHRGKPPATTPALPVQPGKSDAGRRSQRTTTRKHFAGFFRWKKLRFWFKGKKDVVVEEITLK